MAKLSELCVEGVRLIGGDRDPEIMGVTADSRRVGPGDLFAAIPGTQVDGAQFIPSALDAGAAAILCAADADCGDCPVPVVRADNPRRALALMAARFHAHQPSVIAAVTGTSGKTSVADFTRQIFTHCHRQAASLGTIGVIKPEGGVYGSLTTPDPITLHQTLAVLADEGVTHLALEASSHGLDQYRLDGVAVNAAAFSNLGHDHLDYHPTVEDYFTAKLRLFTDLVVDDGVAVVNADDAMAGRVLDASRARNLRTISVGTGAADIALTSARPAGFAQAIVIAYRGQTWQIRLPLIGQYQAENALLAAGLAIGCGEDPEDAFSALSTIKGVPGRLEIVGQRDGALIVVDYAHKPDALAAALAALRPFVTGRLVCVFGCGGDRDKAKRPLMGRIAAQAADVAIVTDDNPRGEIPAAIRAEILAAAPGAREVGDRRDAIATAITAARQGDVILIAGKGHETGQIVGEDVLPFSDHEEARRHLKEGKTGD
ncbi:MAG: UDP-N-acetylmuramoyl-L-alanyl-D-glutamate--2,6-diaminopimelate ligase [Pseudomonadota bacterium]